MIVGSGLTVSLKRFSGSYLRSNFFDMPIEGVIADVQLSIFHPLDGDRSVVDIEVVLEKVFLTWNLLPMELL